MSVWAIWIKAGEDSGSTAEVEGRCHIDWADGTYEDIDFIRRVHHKNRQRAFSETLLSEESTKRMTDTLPTKIEFYPKEDDGSDKRDDSLGTATIPVEHNGDDADELGEDELFQQINHRRKRFEFQFGYRVVPKLIHI